MQRLPVPIHIVLRGLPTTATAGDVRRAGKLVGLQGVADVSLVYNRFSPIGQAVLTMAGPDYTRDAVRAAQNMTFAGCEKITADAVRDPIFDAQRARGIKGRIDAVNRGLLGYGPAGGFPVRKTVTITGFPGKVTIHNFKKLIHGFQLAADDESNSVLMVPVPENKFSMFVRFVVILASESEAQRLVRKFHFTHYKQSRQVLTAAIIY